MTSSTATGSNQPEPHNDLPSKPMLSVKHLDASYGEVQVLRNISFDIPIGNVSVILGANGAGKTTALRSICNMVTHTGTVTFDGVDISRRDTASIVNLGLAHVPQGRGTFSELSVIDNLEVGGYVGKDNLHDDIDRWFQMFPRLKERKDQLAGSLSGGEQQMLAVARALMSRPKLVLLDEPSLGLAPMIIEDLFSRFKELNEESGVTLLIVEQNANLALEIASHGFVLEAGEIMVSQAAEQLRTNSAVRQAYLGA